VADFFLIHSPDQAVLTRTVDAVRPRFHELAPEDRTDRLERPGWSLLISTNAVTPYAVERGPERTAVVLGLTLDGDAPGPAELVAPSPAARAGAAAGYAKGLNFGLALTVSGDEVVAATDWLGLFPVYYRRQGPELVLSSIPGLIASSGPSRPRLDVAGLVGLLLLAHGSLGRTIFDGVSRLPAATVLRFAPAGPLGLERLDLEAPPSAPRTLGEAAEGFGAILDRAVRSAATAGARSIYLSGGLDSRLIAGYLRRNQQGPIQAITLGDRRDLEMKAAARVVKALHLKHEAVPIELGEFPRYAARSIETDALTGGLYTFMEFAFSEAARPRVLTGFLGDVTMGASHIGWGWDPDLGSHGFRAMFRSANAWGLSPQAVREIVRADDIDAVIAGVMGELEAEFDSYPGPPWQRSWMFDLFHRQRFIVGRCPQVMAARSWPVLPFAQAGVLSLVQASQLEFVADRRAEIELLFREFPELARLPLGRLIDSEWWYLVPRKRYVWTPLADRLKSSLVWHWHHSIDPWEPRVFLRAFDFDGPGWRALRDEARAAADAAGEWLNKDAVLRLIPPGDEDARLRRALVDATGRKVLVGAVLGCRRYFG